MPEVECDGNSLISTFEGWNKMRHIAGKQHDAAWIRRDKTVIDMTSQWPYLGIGAGGSGLDKVTSCKGSCIGNTVDDTDQLEVSCRSSSCGTICQVMEYE